MDTLLVGRQGCSLWSLGSCLPVSSGRELSCLPLRCWARNRWSINACWLNSEWNFPWSSKNPGWQKQNHSTQHHLGQHSFAPSWKVYYIIQLPNRNRRPEAGLIPVGYLNVGKLSNLSELPQPHLLNGYNDCLHSWRSNYYLLSLGHWECGTKHLSFLLEETLSK